MAIAMSVTEVDDPALHSLAQQLGQVLGEQGLRLVTAESCTGGWLAKLLTDIPGSSAWFDYAVVSYSNAAKHTLLGVPTAVLTEQGAVSQATVAAMAEGVMRHGEVDCAIAVSGIAGPGGGSAAKPVGTVWLAWALGSTRTTQHYRFTGDRDAVRRQAVSHALSGLLQRLSQSTTLTHHSHTH